MKQSKHEDDKLFKEEGVHTKEKTTRTEIITMFAHFQDLIEKP